MDIGFCVLWMPTVIHKDFDSPITDTSDFFELSDSIPNSIIRQHGDNRIFARLQLKGKNIEIYFFKDKGCSYNIIKEFSVTLIYDDNSHNGLFLYRIETVQATNPFFVGEDGNPKFPCSIYHKIKEFYHNHNFHKPDDGDSMIPPFVSKTKVEIKSVDNEALLHYLNRYEQKFIDSFYFLELYFNKLSRNSLSSKIRFFFGWDNHTSFYMLAMRIKGDKAYFNTLCTSKYNTVFKLTCDNEKATKEDYRCKYFNIHNIIESVGTMENRISNCFNMDVARISFWIAILAVILSIFLSIRY